METAGRHFLLTIGLDYNLDNYERVYYTFLDMLSDIGGVQAIIVGFLAGILSAIKHDYFKDYLVSKLYKLASTSPDEHDAAQNFEGKMYSNVIGCLRDTILPKRCKTVIRSYQGRK